MGVLWSVWPLDDEMRGWLDQQGIEYPDAPSRFPTGGEIRQLLANYPATVRQTENGIGGPLSAFINCRDEERWTLLQVTEFTGDEDEQKLWFEKGSPDLIVDILRRLAVHCGPLALINDTGDPPEIILGGEQLT